MYTTIPVMALVWRFYVYATTTSPYHARFDTALLGHT
jgi:hypothetical protein